MNNKIILKIETKFRIIKNIVNIDGKISLRNKNYWIFSDLKTIIEENDLNNLIKEKIVEEVNKNVDKIIPFILTYDNKVKFRPCINVRWNQNNAIYFDYCIDVNHISPDIIKDIRGALVFL